MNLQTFVTGRRTRAATTSPAHTGHRASPRPTRRDVTRAGPRAVATAAAVVLALTGCGSAPPTGPEARARARTTGLFTARTAYLGDNPRILALVAKVGAASDGPFTLALHTTSAPLGLTVNLKHPVKPFRDTDFREAATLLLGLIGNADQVTFTAGSDSYTLTASAASAAVGFEVKRLGRDRQALADYLGRTAD